MPFQTRASSIAQSGVSIRVLRCSSYISTSFVKQTNEINCFQEHRVYIVCLSSKKARNEKGKYIIKDLFFLLHFLVVILYYDLLFLFFHCDNLKFENVRCFFYFFSVFFFCFFCFFFIFFKLVEKVFEIYFFFVQHIQPTQIWICDAPWKAGQDSHI